MAGLLLLRDLEGKLSFDPETVRATIRGLAGVRNWIENSARHQFFCEFSFSGDSTIVYMLSKNLQFVSIEGMGPASLWIAMEIGRRFGGELHAVDQEYSFDIRLSSVSSIADFEEKMSRKMGQENLPTE
jgi:hypothetical protein